MSRDRMKVERPSRDRELIRSTLDAHHLYQAQPYT